jgi:uncharacterized protein YqfA (UPF0365 family)
MNTGLIIFIIIMAVLAMGAALRFLPFIKLQRAAVMAGVHISLSKIIGMNMRKTNPANIVSLLIKAKKAGVCLTSDMLETVVLSKGRPGSVVEALIAAKSKSMPLEFRLAAAIDISGKDPLEFVASINEPYTEQSVREAAREYVGSIKNSV